MEPIGAPAGAENGTATTQSGTVRAETARSGRTSKRSARQTASPAILDADYERALEAFRRRELEVKAKRLEHEAKELDRKLAQELDALAEREPPGGREGRPGVGWWSTADVLDILGGISDAAWRKSWRPLLREDDPSEVRIGGGKRLSWYRVRALIEAYRERAVREAVAAALAGRGGDLADELLAGGGDSPALERLRLAQAQLKEHELARLRDEYIHRDELYEGLRISAGIIQQFIEEARKACPEIAGLADKMIERWKRENRRRFGASEGTQQ